MKSVYSAVRSGSLNKEICASSLKGYYLAGVSTSSCAHLTVILSSEEDNIIVKWSQEDKIEKNEMGWACGAYG